MSNESNIERWETPISELDGLELISLYDNGMNGLILSVGTSSGSDFHQGVISTRYQVNFGKCVAYRKEATIATFMTEEERQSTYGNTIVVTDSEWLKEMRRENAVLDMEYPDLVHRIIRTGGNTVEVASVTEPHFQKV